ncbi:hypothetical protein M127_5116 [Bacteroides fragilis str. S6L5]|nr:hypothetical protein M127_5116 [Bacteroides fragilis str. S6L5]
MESMLLYLIRYMVSPLRGNLYNRELVSSLCELANPTSPHPILTIPEGPLNQLNEGTPASNTSIANLMRLHHIQPPLSYVDNGNINTCSGVKKKPSVSIFHIRPYFIQFNDTENRSKIEQFLYYLCKVVSILLSPVLGKVIHHVFIIYQLAKQYFTLRFNERSIINFITKDETISSWRKGEYIASASALNHSKRSLLYLIAERVANLILGIVSLFSICALVIAIVLCFRAGTRLFDLIAAFAPLAMIISMWDTELSSSISALLTCGIIYAIPGAILYPFFTNSSLGIIFVSGIISCVLGMIYFVFYSITHTCTRRAISSINRSLLSLHISEQIHESGVPNTSLSRSVAKNCLDPYSSLLNRQTFSEEAALGPEEPSYPQDLSGILPLPPPPPYTDRELPPSYEEAIREGRR